MRLEGVHVGPLHRYCSFRSVLPRSGGTGACGIINHRVRHYGVWFDDSTGARSGTDTNSDPYGIAESDADADANIIS
jgi:hypothetical protein